MTKALRDGSPTDAAGAAMASHLGRLFVEVEDFAASDFSNIFSRLISSIDATDSANHLRHKSGITDPCRTPGA